MKKLLALTFVAVPLLATSAFAATDTGTIKMLSASKNMLELADGKTFSVPKSINLHAFKVSEKVRVTYSTTNGKRLATKIVAAK